MKSLRPERLTFFIKATATVAALLYEQIAADCTGFHARSVRSGAAVHVRDGKCVRTLGLEDDEALLPVTRSGFQGYRLLQEYFILPERLLFFTLQDLGGLFAQAEGEEIEIYLGLARAQPLWKMPSQRNTCGSGAHRQLTSFRGLPTVST